MRKIQHSKKWKFYMITMLSTLFSIALYAQTTTFNGKVVDDTGLPLPGASVRVTGTTTGVTTNINGDFSLNASPGIKSITISFIGFTDQQKAISRGVTNLGTITLQKNARDLNEVVVVGYGTVKRADVTGTVATVDAKVLQEIPASNVFEQLKGRVAGLDVSSNTSGTPIITIRGNRTIGSAPGTDGPLVVLDGQPYYNSIENIDPNDIKSVDVLKGASATAIYGSRGSGGVILITTNRGRVGQTITTYDSYVGINKLEGQLKVLNGTEFAQLQADALQGSVLQGNGATNPYALTAIQLKALQENVSTDYANLLVKNGMVWDQSLRVSGGTEKTQFTVGAGYRINTGIEPNNSTKRISLNLTLDHKINDYIKFGLSSQTSLRLITAGGGSQLQSARYMSPLTYPYNADGSINILPQSDQLDATTLNPLVPGRSPDQFYNDTRGYVSNNILYGEVSPVNHLKYRYTVGYNFSQSLAGTYNGINGAGILSIAQTNASTTNNYSYRLNQEHLLTYDNTFAKKHAVNFVAGFTVENAHTENSSISGTGIPQDAVRNENMALAGIISAVSGSYIEQSIISYVGRLNYAFDHRYDLTATFRSDANSALAQGHQTTTYPSVGLGWVISNENFMKRFAFIDNLKLRAGYGQTSTIASIAPYGTLGQLSQSKYQYGGSSAGNAQGVLVTQLPNVDLTWQRTGEYNIALDFAVLKNRITGSVEVFKQRTTGIILNNILPGTTGVRSQNSNLGTSEDKGLELTLSSVNLQNAGGFNWATDFNISFIRERVVELPNGALSATGVGEFVGQPLSTIYDLKKIGIWQTSEATQAAVYGQKPGQIKIEDYFPDGKINSADNQFIGNFQPQYTFGLTNRFNYKNFDLNIVIQAKMDFTTIVPYVSSSNSALTGWQYLNLGRHNQPVIDYWTPNNPTNAFPEPNANFQPPYYSTLQYYDGSFIRAKSINVGYNVPAKLTKHIGMSSLRIYANVTNPFFIYAPVRNHSFSVPDAESVYNTVGANTVAPTGVSATGNIAGFDPNNAFGSPFRGLGIYSGTATRDFIIGINARF
ncbi:SusC/RagA family TonB-linked outer membrane protein [Mucilaginibacter sp. HMF5004]|uniref:SusC/RagA family TonB-linked outer membrane protein n=1 Tax=Mucilaginibacter rivuli TaxID=2857527 RepID=UPI001C60180D|nr:SusC/RagA family TonB-linked outer membrane protein [Mucilaginibacter rivuli]MBW4890694.1 SusC/RagA family TonB-linked outer membrane protein [Mucilaginibacter rivuli]